MVFKDQLQSLCKKNGLHISGNKSDLIERLQQHNIDPNLANEESHAQSTTQTSNEPSWKKLTQQIATTLPPITVEFISQFNPAKWKRARGYVCSHDWFHGLHYVENNEKKMIRGSMKHSMKESERLIRAIVTFNNNNILEDSTCTCAYR
jgi:hypothetical protein